jgi:hypothetical protein
MSAKITANEQGFVSGNGIEILLPEQMPNKITKVKMLNK